MAKMKKTVSFDDITIKRDEEKQRRLRNSQCHEDECNDIVKVVLFSVLVICVLIMTII